MSADFEIPPQVEAVIARFDAEPGPFEHHDVSGEIVAAARQLQSLSDGERAGVHAEVFAFGVYGHNPVDSPWGTFFGPMASSQNEEGETVHLPSVDGLTGQALDHWSRRASASRNAVLRARYADLAWDMADLIGGRRRDPAMATVAVDAYLQTSELISRYALRERFDCALRALNLAILIRDEPRTERARLALLRLHREDMDGTSPQLWWIAFDRLEKEKRAGVSDAEREQFVRDLEGLARRFGDQDTPQSFDPHALRGATERLIRHYQRLGAREDVRRLHEATARAFEYHAGTSGGLAAPAFMQTAVNAFRSAGLPDESRRARVLMEQGIAEAKAHMGVVETRHTISHETMESFLDSVVREDLGETFLRIAVEFLPSRKSIDEEVTKSLESTPLVARLPTAIVEGEHVSARIGSAEDDPFGRAIHQATIHLSLSGIWLELAMSRTLERHEPGPEHFVGWANRHGLFDDLTFLNEGIRAWFDGDFVKAIHVLVPQVECGLRAVVGQLGLPTTKAHPTIPDVGVAITMGDALYSEAVRDALGPDLTLHLLSICADPRGLNLRNRVAHGTLPAEQADGHMVRLIIHTLLVLGVWESLAKARR